MTTPRKPESGTEPHIGEYVGPYRVDALLGEGGMARVYRASGPDGEQVALKLAKADVAIDPVLVRRFDREASVAARVIHPHVVPVLHVGRHGTIPYMAQQLIPGGSLQERIDRRGPLDLEEVVSLCLQVAAGLEALHALGLIHRDLKPANILLNKDGSARITDFGLAKDLDATILTSPGQVVGSMDYMAPEQVRGGEVTPAVDVYALGCVTYACVSGHPPFAGREGMKALWAHLQEEPPDPCADRDDVPPGLGGAINRALEKEPDQRPSSAAGYARLIQEAALGPNGLDRLAQPSKDRS